MPAKLCTNWLAVDAEPNGVVWYGECVNESCCVRCCRRFVGLSFCGLHYTKVVEVGGDVVVIGGGNGWITGEFILLSSERIRMSLLLQLLLAGCLKDDKIMMRKLNYARQIDGERPTKRPTRSKLPRRLKWWCYVLLGSLGGASSSSPSGVVGRWIQRRDSFTTLRVTRRQCRRKDRIYIKVLNIQSRHMMILVIYIGIYI